MLHFFMLRFLFEDFFARMWLCPLWRLLILPEPVSRKRLAADRFVLSFMGQIPDTVH